MRQSIRIGESSQQVETTSLAGAYRTGFFYLTLRRYGQDNFLIRIATMLL